jgi:hypothetical protein
MAKQIKRTNRFSAYDEEGRKYTIFEFTEYLDASTWGSDKMVEGLKELRTADGIPVNRIKKGVYRIMGVEEIEVTSDDPDAA